MYLGCYLNALLSYVWRKDYLDKVVLGGLALGVAVIAFIVIKSVWTSGITSENPSCFHTITTLRFNRSRFGRFVGAQYHQKQAGNHTLKNVRPI